jgi:hypothetical protein
MIDTTYSISQANFLEAQKMWCSDGYKHLPGRILYQFVSIVFGVLVGWSLRYLPLWMIGAVSVSLIAFYLVGQWRKNAIRKFQYSQNANQMQNMQVQIDETGYRDKKEGISEAWVSWNNFEGWRESKTIFVIGRNLNFVTIPKAGLTAEQEQELRDLLRSSVKATT